jgi:hypothetical protein
MSYLGNAINNINPATPTNRLGIIPQKGGPLVADVHVGFPFNLIRVRTAGDVNLMGIDGNPMLIIDVQPGFYTVGEGFGYLSSGTTATGVHWYSGGQ